MEGNIGSFFYISSRACVLEQYFIDNIMRENKTNPKTVSHRYVTHPFYFFIHKNQTSHDYHIFTIILITHGP